MLRNRFQEDNVVRAQQIAMQNFKDCFSVDPVMSKVFEGMAKGMTDDKIIAAMEQVQYRQAFTFQIARKLSNDPQTVNIIAQTAYDALSARMQEKEMEQIAARLGVTPGKEKDFPPAVTESKMVPVVQAAESNEPVIFSLGDHL